MKSVAIIGAHENSLVLKDTIASVEHYLTKEILLVVDGINGSQFEDNDRILKGFPHGRPQAPYRNVCLGLMEAWNKWGDVPDWYCYVEYDCLFGSHEIRNHLGKAKEMDFWILGNDFRKEKNRIPILDHFFKSKLNPCYFLGCCVFYNSKFIRALAKDNFFERFLYFTNFYDGPIIMVDNNGKKQLVYDISEFLYPTMAVAYGGKISELACWKEGSWTGNAEFYPMRFRPDLDEKDSFKNACVMHPLKNIESPLRQYHRNKRLLDTSSFVG
jgi:hypothetical protein